MIDYFEDEMKQVPAFATLYIAPDLDPPVKGRFSSGAFKSIHDQWQADEFGWLLTPEGESLGGRHLMLGKARSAFSDRRGSGQVHLKKKWVAENHVNFSNFIFRGDSSTLLKELCKNDRGADIEVQLHADYTGTQWGIGLNSGMGLAKTHGAKVVANTSRLADAWNKWHKSTRDRFLAGTAKSSRPDLLGLHVLHDPFVDFIRPSVKCTYTQAVQEAVLPGCVLARMAQVKRLDLALGLGLTYITSHVDAFRIDLTGEEVVLNQSHAVAMEVLASSAFLVSTWGAETFGINAFEAAERGVPVILCEDGQPHASRSFLPEWAYITCASTPDAVKAAIAAIPSEWGTMEFRNRLSTFMRSSYK